MDLLIIGTTNLYLPLKCLSHSGDDGTQVSSGEDPGGGSANVSSPGEREGRAAVGSFAEGQRSRGGATGRAQRPPDQDR